MASVRRRSDSRTKLIFFCAFPLRRVNYPCRDRLSWQSTPTHLEVGTVKTLHASVVTLVFLISGFAFGQQGLIDGSVTPNRIPEAVAQRIIFIALSNPSSVQQVRNQLDRLWVE